MRWNHFAGSLLFAGLAALGFPAGRLVLGPVLGPVWASQLYLVATAACYLLCVAPTLRRGVSSGLSLGLLGALLVLGGVTTPELCLGLASGVAIARSVLLYRAPVVRGWLVELLLCLGGLALARGLASPGLLGASLALWGYFLVQSLYFPFAAVAPRRGRSGDAFDEARDRLRVLLRESEV